MHRTNIYLDERQTERLDLLAESEGTSRAAVIRRLIDRGLGMLEADARLASDLAAIDRSFGVLAERVETLQRAPDDRAAHLARIWSSS